MLDDYKNLKDTNSGTGSIIKDNNFSLSYKKSNKLVTAVYIVTDIMDTEEPIRSQIRSRSVELLSDINGLDQNRSGGSLSIMLPKVREIISLLDIASTVKLISTMNYSILKKEFIELEASIAEYGKVRSIWVEEFLVSPNPETEENILVPDTSSNRTQTNNFKGHNGLSSRTIKSGTRLGVQKGGTLMQALSDKANFGNKSHSVDFDLLKKERRYEIIQVLKTNDQGYTITDIKSKGHEMKLNSIVSCGEKTLQRELVAMVKDGVLYKKGEKRWSRYSIKK